MDNEKAKTEALNKKGYILCSMLIRGKGETDWIEEGKRAICIKEIFLLHNCIPSIGETLTDFCKETAVERKLTRIS